MSRFSSIEDVHVFLNTIPMFSKAGATAGNFSLGQIREFCAQIGNPQDQLKSIHVAGTNGKGTVCYLLEAVYRQAGYKTGMFTSPHLLRYNERVRVNGREVTDDMLLNFFQETGDLLDRTSLTYFELSTALAFWIFHKEKVDIAIIETGLGGRLDATNIIFPQASVITSIGLDHEQILGGTIQKIATEKAGIIKEGKPVIVGDLPAEAREVVAEQTLKMKASMHQAADLKPDFLPGRIYLQAVGEEFEVNLIEPVNKWNLAIAWKTIEVLNDQFPVSKAEFRSAAEQFEGVPARFEKLMPDRNWYFSGSHNEQAMEVLMEGVNQFDADEKIVVFSAMKDKIKPAALRYLQNFDRRYFVEQTGERAAKKGDLPDNLEVELLEENRFYDLQNEFKTPLVIFTGSFYFYPIIKRWVTNLKKIT